MKVSNAKEVAMKTDGKNAFYEQNPAIFAFNLNILLFFLGRQKEIVTCNQLMPKPS